MNTNNPSTKTPLGAAIDEIFQQTKPSAFSVEGKDAAEKKLAEAYRQFAAQRNLGQEAEVRCMHESLVRETPDGYVITGKGEGGFRVWLVASSMWASKRTYPYVHILLPDGDPGIWRALGEEIESDGYPVSFETQERHAASIQRIIEYMKNDEIH